MYSRMTSSMYSRMNAYRKNSAHNTYNSVSSISNKNAVKSKITENSASSNSVLLRAANQLKNANLEQLSFKGNVIDIKKGCNYSVKTLLHGNTQVSIDDYSSKLLLYKMYPTEDVPSLYSEDEFNDMAKTNELVGFLSSGKPTDEIINLIRIFLPDWKDTGARLQSLGIEPDKYIEIKGQSEKLFLDGKSGITYTQTEIENLNKAYNRDNYFKMGYTKDSVFTIDGKDYKLDDAGHLNIPSDVICIPSRVSIKK